MSISVFISLELKKGKLLDTLLSFKIESETKKQILKEDFEITMTAEIKSEVMIMCNLSDEIERNRKKYHTIYLQFNEKLKTFYRTSYYIIRRN